MGKGNEKRAKKAPSDKVTFLNSIAFKIIAMVLLCMTVIVVVSTVVTVKKSKSTVTTTTHDYMLYMAKSERDMLNQKMISGGMSAEFFAGLLENVKMDGVSSSYAYLVSKDGNMLYHPTADKIGKPVENAVVTGLVAEIAAGKTPEDGVVTYEFKGAQKYASYAITKNNQILVISADEDDVLAPIVSVRNQAVILDILLILISLAIVYFATNMMVAPIKKVSAIIMDTAAFNFKHNPNSAALCARKDENGVMARAVSEMRKSLRAMVGNIDEASQMINGNVNQLQDVTNVVNSMCTDNSATTEELAAGMQETAATTENINANIGYMQTGVKDIEQLSQQGDELSNEVMKRAESLREKTMEASGRTKSIYESVKVRSDAAIEESKSVHKINELTEAIMAISSQTSLLALNASIEAARAGEAGRGFAVVATEIGNLATQTSQTVGEINGIVTEVNKAVANMAGCLEETGSFLENTVLGDYKGFEDVSKQYTDDAQKFKESMNDVHESVVSLSHSIDQISDAIEGINATVGESTMGVTDIAGKTTDMVTRTAESTDLVEESRNCVDRLQSIVGEFIME